MIRLGDGDKNECKLGAQPETPLLKWYRVKLLSVRSMFYGIPFKTATLGQFLEIFILVCLISRGHVIFEQLFCTVHEVPTTPPCAPTLSVLLQKNAVKSQACSSGYFICPDHLCKKTDEIKREKVASVSGAPTYHSPSDICLGSCCSATSTYLVTVEFLLCSVSKD